jgi:hypothetical protein
MLYVFGDSFSHPFSSFDESNKLRETAKEYPPFIPIKNNWVNLVAERLTGTTDQINDSMAGAANEFIFHRFMDRMSQYKEGDYVIVCLTNENRRWLIEGSPHLSNFANSKIDEGVTKQEYKAIQQYAKYLHSDIASNAIYNSIIWATIHGAVNLEPLGVKMLILPGWHTISGVEGSLTEASFREFDSIETRNAFYKKTNDSRWNHFSEENHKVLADKVCDFFTDFKMIDLTTGFKSNIYTKDNI